MTFSVSTRWNAYRHRSGEELIAEILSAGFSHVELSYDLTINLLPGILQMVKDNSVTVDSLHNYCPVPVGAPMGHPELFSLSALNERERQAAVRNTVNTINHATEVGAKAVVVHAGRVAMRSITHKLIDLYEKGDAASPKYEKLKLRLITRRQKKVQKHLDKLSESLEEILPILQKSDIRLGLENLPSWETLPNEMEMLQLAERFGTDHIGYWHDFGHGQVRQTLGFIGQLHWMEKLSHMLVGMHVHDALPPANDHLMPPQGEIDFPAFKDFIQSDIIPVFEPIPGTPLEALQTGVTTIRRAWGPQEDNGG